jgi:hypothetical protein
MERVMYIIACAVSLLHELRKEIYDKSFLYNSPPQSLSFAAACSGVISRCGSAINSYPTRNFLTVALLRSGG